ncbi:putative reverse transcriptase zinc-binding domain-containing protein [Helianthus anomalus]
MEVYLDLFRLAKNKNNTVAENRVVSDGSVGWRWDWCKDPSTASEWAHIGDLMSRFSQVNICNAKDTWLWESEAGTEFSVKNIRKDIANADQGQDDGMGFVWNSWAPLKVNYLLWRALLGKVATKNELHKRGVTLQDLLCPRCGYVVETTDHLFTDCLLAKNVWWQVCVWMMIPLPPNTNSLNDFMVALIKNPGDKRWKKLVNLVAQAIVWRLWNTRNAKIFEGKNTSIQATVDLIKEDSYSWVTHRSKSTVTSWENWLSFNVVSML